jgi:hypothetical protein
MLPPRKRTQRNAVFIRAPKDTLSGEGQGVSLQFYCKACDLLQVLSEV